MLEPSRTDRPPPCMLSKLFPLLLANLLLAASGCSVSSASQPMRPLDALVDEGNSNEVERTLRELHRKTPSDPEVMTQLARVEYNRAIAGLPRNGGMPPTGWDPTSMDAAEAWVLQAIAADPRHANAWVVHGQIMFARAQLDQSLEMFARAEALDPSSIKLHLRKGATLRALSEIRLERDAYLQASLREYEQAIHGDIDDGNEVLAASELADIYSALGHYDKALQYSASAAKSAKGNSKAFVLDKQAMIRLNHGDIDGALADSEAALALLDFGVGRDNLAKTLLVKAGTALREGRTAEAKALTARLMETGADPWQALYLLASKPTTFNAIYVFAEGTAKGTPRAANIGSMLPMSGGFITANDVKRLHDLGIEFNAKDETIGTVLHEAIRHNNVESVRALLELGADPNALHPSGRTPLELALTGTTPERREIRHLLMARTAVPKGWKEPNVDLPLAGHWYIASHDIGAPDPMHPKLQAGTRVQVESNDCWFPDRTDICLGLRIAPDRRLVTVAVPLTRLDDLNALREVPAPNIAEPLPSGL